MFVLAVTSQY